MICSHTSLPKSLQDFICETILQHIKTHQSKALFQVSATHWCSCRFPSLPTIAVDTHHPGLSHCPCLMAPHCLLCHLLFVAACTTYSQCTLLRYRLVWGGGCLCEKGWIPTFQTRRARCPHSTPGSRLLWQLSHKLQSTNISVCTGALLLGQFHHHGRSWSIFFTSLKKSPWNEQNASGC